MSGGIVIVAKKSNLNILWQTTPKGDAEGEVYFTFFEFIQIQICINIIYDFYP
jgi:hypothetical protein